ncbi:hypothetical protein HNR23_001776 [Nocardiopsis mwathae]|uniref:Uncharacterized protein n=1 Tax=Nocardiopsis mwathae TaxID=1472723 RepID=A0A7W9YIC5_9ACTN|nr:DUF6247 family protein [Nocardiopsis mwathae]MBB6171716.1 hypothetical protein [Nocardiopsis mwathae]
MPELTPAALRAAVRQIAPTHLPSFGTHLEQAAEQAAAQSTVAPLHAFLQWWGEFVAIHRYPGRAAHLCQLEEAVATSDDPHTVRRSAAEIREIMESAQREVSAG